ncbi:MULTISPECIES: helix-turn-helix domain-containing protein [unclassified Kitasatospora]|uniref:helix-turn-helix domain-containing protein n=1 Tax=unclassified Kitasatospora TaxID=2633591 RepID=UPI002473D942|nr:XRE family transcriptional regulator [Kitasatospora sp. MAP12-44]
MPEQTTANWKFVAARVERGWCTQEDFAEAYNAAASALQSKAQISVRQIRRWESGQTTWPNKDARSVLPKMFGVSLEQLGFIPRASVPRRLDAPSDLKPDLEDHVLRRTFVGGLVAAAAPLLDLAALDHLTAATRDAHRYSDQQLVEHLRGALDETARADVLLGPHRAMPAALGILSVINTAARDAKPDVRRQLLNLGARAAEFTAWLHRDAGSPDQTTGYWYGQSKEWATFTGDGAMHAYVLLRQAQALGRNDPARILDLAGAATSGPWTLPPRPRAEAFQQKARGLAMTGAGEEEIRRVLDQAHAALDQAAPPSGAPSCTGPLGDGYTRTRLLVQSAICWREAKLPAEAVSVFQTYLIPERFLPRDHAHYSAYLSGALAEVGEPDEAASVALTALEIAVPARYGQAITELHRTASILFPHRQRSAVRELHERLLVLTAS